VGISFTENDGSEELYNRDFNALLIAMLLDQQIPITWAFGGPARLAERLGHFDLSIIAAMDTEEFVALACTKPAIHRYPAVMARRAQLLAAEVVERYDGESINIWNDGADAATVKQRLEKLPGYGDEKAKILLAVLGKRFGVRPRGWKQACSPFSDNQPRSVADIDSKSALERVKDWKATQRAAGKSKQQ